MYDSADTEPLQKSIDHAITSSAHSNANSTACSSTANTLKKSDILLLTPIWWLGIVTAVPDASVSGSLDPSVKSCI